jgi:CubicO group peptidase (beta-lactamase class C family)
MSTTIIRVLLLGSLLPTLGGTAALAQGADPGPDTPVSSDAEQSFPDFEDGATVAEPDASIVDPTETRWDHIVVAPDGQTLWVYYWGGTDACYGLASVELGVPNTTRTKFRLASVSKSFTALAVLQLVEQSRLRLDDPLARYVPDFAGGEKITIYHLLTHTAGLPDFMSFDEAKKLPPDSAPGERLNYSNIGYVTLGRSSRR